MRKAHDINRAATRWVLRVSKGRLPQKQWLKFKIWFALDPRHRDAFLRIHAEQTLQKPRRFWQPLRSAASWTALVLALTVFPLFHATPKEPKLYSYTTTFGETKQVRLPDGSSLELSPTTHVSGTVTDKQRLFNLLSGEVIFQVAPDRNSPFIVQTGHVRIRVLGTRFDVDDGESGRYIGERSARIAVFDGAVQVTRDDTSSESVVNLSAGQQLEIADDRTRVALLRVITDRDVASMTAWTRGEIEFHNQPLRKVFVEYARYQHIRVDAADPTIMNFHMSGYFFSTGVDTFLQSLSLQCIHSSSHYESGTRIITLTRSAEPLDCYRLRNTGHSP